MNLIIQKQIKIFLIVILIIIGIIGLSMVNKQMQKNTIMTKEDAISLVLNAYCKVQDEDMVKKVSEFFRQLPIIEIKFRDKDAEERYYRDISEKRVWLWQKVRSGVTQDQIEKIEANLFGLNIYSDDTSVMLEKMKLNCEIKSKGIILSEIISGINTRKY